MQFVRRVSPVAVLGLALSALPALAGSHTWSGATNGTWSVGTNWSAGGAPVNGESSVVLVFPQAQSNMGVMNNDLTGLNVTSITFSDTAYVVTGNAINLNGSIACDNGTNYSSASVNVDILLTGDATFSSTSVPTPFREVFLAIGGVISGAFNVNIQCAGGGQGGEGVTLSGNNTFTGPGRIWSGTVTVNGSNAALFVTNYLGSGGGTLRGTGTVAGITAGGPSAVANVVAPGTAAAPGTLSAFGTVSLGVNSTFQVRLNGPNVLTDYDQLFLPFGGPTLTGSALAVTLGYAAAVGEQFTIINDGEGPPPTGTFNGLPEGATFVAGGETFQIAYSGGPLQNNVILTVTSATPVDLSRFAAE